MDKNSKILVAGGTGMVGSAIIRKLVSRGYTNILTTYHNRLPENTIDHILKEKDLITFQKINLLDSSSVSQLFVNEKPDFVILAAAKVGGIIANNTYRAQFLYENLQIQNNIIHQSYLNGVKKLLFLGSSCIYPRNAPQPIKEDSLLGSDLEYTNEPYAIAKIAGIKMCESYNLQYGTNFISVMPTNLYGYNDNYDLEKSHVLPAMIRKMHLGKCLYEGNWIAIRKDFNNNPVEEVDGNFKEEKIYEILNKYGISKTARGDVKITLWGTGTPMREFLHADDMADGCIFILEKIDFSDTYEIARKEVRNTHINLGAGTDLTIKQLAELIKGIVGYNGILEWDTTKPDGTKRKLMDSSKINALGWKSSIELHQGIEMIYKAYCK